MSEKMEKTLQELKVLVRELILEMGDLKERIAQLETAHRLQTTGQPMPNEDSAEEKLIPAETIIALQGEGYEHLGTLYQDGFHVCHAAFGKPRTDGCLFCLSMLAKQ